MSLEGVPALDDQARQIIESLAARGVRPRGMSADSRTLRPGDLFAAYRGARSDGRRFVPEAIAAGAAAVLWDEHDARWDRMAGGHGSFPNLAVRNLRGLSGPIASLVYGEPSRKLWVVGVTGTNGKTSTTQWIARALQAADGRCAVVGTLGNGFPGELAHSMNTTPEAITLQSLLADFLAQGAGAVAMEVSSIALDQGRTNGVAISCAVLTNLTRDHLDYHGTISAYREAKVRLFAVPSLTHMVLNLDDPLGRSLAQDPPNPIAHRIGYGLQASPQAVAVAEYLHARHILDDGSLRFEVTNGEACASVAAPLAGRFNVSNLLAVIGVLRARGLPLEQAASIVGALGPVPGRMEPLAEPGKPLVLIDYAHSPDALDQVLQAARVMAEARGGRLILVFGCGGDRDRGKRPEMGAIALAHADQVFVTSDNPRSEAPSAIIQAILEGLLPGGASRVRTIEDRALAIAAAVNLAAARDVLVIAGKGHEDYQEIGGVRHPFSDRSEARKALARWPS